MDIQTPPLPELHGEYTPETGPKSTKGKIAIIAVILVIAIILGLGIYFLLIKKYNNKNIDKNATSSSLQIKEEQFDSVIDTTYQIDKDFDGISDEDEKKYNTSHTSNDTDGDGLTDYAEIFIYGSDPLKQDTDGDGYIDGLEVRNGYSPTSTGKL